MWAAVNAETGGRLDVKVCPQNDGLLGGDPEALQMLLAGEVEFYTLMGGLLGVVAPVAEITGLPFAFASHAQVFAAIDGDLGDYVRHDLLAKGIYAVPRACFENGFRHISTSTKPIHTRRPGRAPDPDASGAAVRRLLRVARRAADAHEPQSAL